MTVTPGKWQIWEKDGYRFLVRSLLPDNKYRIMVAQDGVKYCDTYFVERSFFDGATFLEQRPEPTWTEDQELVRP